MKSSTVIGSIVLASVLSVPSGAQYRAPVGVQRLELSAGFEAGSPAPPTGSPRLGPAVCGPHPGLMTRQEDQRGHQAWLQRWRTEGPSWSGSGVGAAGSHAG